MKIIGKTRSFIPLIMAIIGGVFGIVGGLCNGICAEVLDSATELVVIQVDVTLMMISGYILLGVSILGLISGCIARSVAVGCLLLLISGVLAAACFVLLWIAQSGFPGIILIAPAVLLPLGGLLGMTKIKTEQPVDTSTDSNI